MHKMSDDKKILIGKIVAAQGLRGEIRVQTYTSKPDDIKDLEILDTDIKFIRCAGHDIAICKIQNINDRNAAEELRGTQLYINRDSLPDNLPDNEYYQTDLIGMKVKLSGKNIGKAAAIYNFGAGDILELENGEMLSFVGAYVDFETKTITIKEIKTEKIKVH